MLGGLLHGSIVSCVTSFPKLLLSLKQKILAVIIRTSNGAMLMCGMYYCFLVALTNFWQRQKLLYLLFTMSKLSTQLIEWFVVSLESS